MRFDLAPMVEALDRLGRPDRRLRSIIVAGTNGKGSSCAFLTSIATNAGIRVGTYTSPHIECVTERIALDGEPVSQGTFALFASSLIDRLDPNHSFPFTYFEFLTLLAVEIFAASRVDLSIFEVGLGGRLDATNALERRVTVITSIDFDHTALLGSTLPLIAAEKGAIFRNGVPALVARQLPEAGDALYRVASAIGAPCESAGKDFDGTGSAADFMFEGYGEKIGPVRLGIPGEHQVENAATAAATALSLRRLGIPISIDAIERGLRSAHLPGRMELWRDKQSHRVWLDLGHNPEAAASVAAHLRAIEATPVDLIIGVLADKDWRGILEEFRPIAEPIRLVPPKSPRAWSVGDAALFLGGSEDVLCYADPISALIDARERSKNIVCTGSTYTIAPIRPILHSLGLVLVA